MSEQSVGAVGIVIGRHTHELWLEKVPNIYPIVTLLSIRKAQKAFDYTMLIKNEKGFRVEKFIFRSRLSHTLQISTFFSLKPF